MLKTKIYSIFFFFLGDDILKQQTEATTDADIAKLRKAQA